MTKPWSNLRCNVLTVGILSILVGTFYLPTPWYILGGETEAEIGVWGLTSVIGGLIACVGSSFLSNKNTVVQKGLHIIAFLGMILFILAQVLPLFFWIMFWGANITEGGVANPTTGGLHGLLPHILMVAFSIFAMLSILKPLFGKASELRLSRKEIRRTGILLLLIFLIWVGIDPYLSQTWIKSTMPRSGEENVSVYTLVTATWEGERSNIGIRVRYADQPDLYIPGTTSGSQSSISFGAEGGFLPGKEVNVTVEAGRRSYSYSFMTAKE